MRDITLNPEQRLYVIATGGGMRPPGRPKGAYRSAEHGGLSVSCFGFDNARDHARQIAQRLDRPDLMPTADDAASLTGYEKYLAAVRAWGESAQGHSTYFDPGTDPRLARVLETCRRDGRKVRLVLGDNGTGASWLDEFDVVGTVGRSTGLLKVPLLVEPGEAAGTAILGAHVLALMDWLI